MKAKTIFSLVVGLGSAAWVGRSIAEEPKPAEGAKLALVTKAAPTVQRIELPPESANFRPGLGLEQAQTLCMSCHSADYISSQPPMPRKFWEASVKKMKEKFGAPLPDDINVLVDYLTATYGTK